MPTPWKHPQTGIYWYRRRVPRDLVALLGKTEVRRTLGTREPADARVAHAKVAAEIEERWRGLRAGVRTLSQKEALAIAGDIYREIVGRHEDNPGDPAEWGNRLLHDWMVGRPEKVRVVPAGADREKTLQFIEKIKAVRNRKLIDEHLAQRGLRVDEESLQRIKKAVDVAVCQAHEQVHRYAQGDYRPDPDADRFPKFEIAASTSGEERHSRGSRSDTLAVFEAYAKERGTKPSTLKNWRPIIVKVAAEHPDLRTLTRDWCIDWKGRLIESGFSQKRVRDGYLACLRAVCAWACDNGHIPTNPMAGVTLRVKKRSVSRPLSYSNSEAQKILAAALQEPIEKLSPKGRAARRWIPWLCAYTGARVGEMGQLRQEDVIVRDGIPVLWVRPEAGTTEDGNSRYVAIHPHLIEQGFLEFVRRSGKGPLFYDPSRQRGGSDANPQFKKVGERIAKWVRGLGIDDMEIQPNHAWRHRFKTVARKVGMDSATMHYMQGHAPATEGDAYGHYESDVLLREISKMPRYEVDPDCSGNRRSGVTVSLEL